MAEGNQEGRQFHIHPFQMTNHCLLFTIETRRYSRREKRQSKASSALEKIRYIKP